MKNFLSICTFISVLVPFQKLPVFLHTEGKLYHKYELIVCQEQKEIYVVIMRGE